MGYSFWNQERKKERKKKKKKKKKKTVDSVCHPFLHRPLITQTRRRHFLGWLQFRFVFPWLIDWDNRFDSNLFLLVANGYHTTNEDSSMFWSDFNAIFLRFFFRSFVVFTGCQWLPDDRWGFEYVLTRFLRFFSNLFSFVWFLLDSIEKSSLSTIILILRCFYWLPMVTRRPMRTRVGFDPILMQFFLDFFSFFF